MRKVLGKESIRVVLDQETFFFEDGPSEDYGTCPKCFEMIPKAGNENECGECGQKLGWRERRG